MINKILMLTVSITLVACNNSGNSGNSKTSLTEGIGGAPVDINLEGSYSSGCVNDGEKSFIDTFEFMQTSAEVTVVNFEGTNCRPGAEVERFKSKYSFTFDGSLIEFTKGNYFYTFFDNALTSGYNESQGFCEITDWNENEEREITGKNCDGEFFITGEKFLVSASKQESALIINNNKYRKI